MSKKYGIKLRRSIYNIRLAMLCVVDGGCSSLTFNGNLLEVGDVLAEFHSVPNNFKLNLTDNGELKIEKR